MMMGMAARMGSAPAPTAVTAMAVGGGRRLDQDRAEHADAQSDPGVFGEGEHAVRGVAAQPRETTADNAHCADQQVDQPSYTAPAENFGPYGKLDPFGARRRRWGRSYRAAGSRGLPRDATVPRTVVRPPIGWGILHATNATELSWKGDHPVRLAERAAGLRSPVATLAGEGPKSRLPRVPSVDNGSAGDEVVQRATITLEQNADEP